MRILRPAALLAAMTAIAAPPPPQLNLRLTMRDGVELSANLWLPEAKGKFPLAFYRTPYGKTDRLTSNLRAFVDAGYAVMLQDVRGRGDSGGVFRQLVQEENDAEDTLNWVRRQPWSNGQAGLFGASYPGIAAWQAARSGHPAIRAIATGFCGADEYLDRYYSPGGAFRLGHRLWWLAQNFSPAGRKRPTYTELVRHRPLRTADVQATGRTLDFYQAAMDHPSYDSFWRSLSTLQAAGRMNVPAHLTGGWYDPYCSSDISLFNTLRAAGVPVRLVIGPWGHNPAIALETVDPAAAAIELRKLEVEWFDACLRGGPKAATGIRYFVPGLNAWRETPQWPPTATGDTEWYLAPDQRLAPKPRRKGGQSTFSYNPDDAVPTLGGATCCDPRVQPWGPLDQRPLDRRQDVLHFTGAPLEEGLEIAGAVRAVLHLQSDAPDTDFSAKLVDVAPDGTARLVCDGLIRLRYRHGLDRPVAYQPGATERVVVPLGDIAWYFPPGHRVRLDVSSSNFPRFDRNPNTGRPVAGETRTRIARQTILFGRAHPSRLLLPAKKRKAHPLAPA